MHVKEHEESGIVVLKLKGDLLGGDDYQTFKDTLKKYISEGKKDFVIDLRKVTYINSSGIGMLVSGMTTVTNAEGTFKLANVEQNIHNVFTITNLISIFDVYETLEDALNAE
ncbi:anti-sigma-factor antagonist [Chloroherpeton thalassium ATCC 35110]|uniref:Anti-sigma factor antagonist n=1 Tax=Chloroherpeton thalassium (strain ATCC 35110 / GB-78) TaxID=517418 RepID=B3QSS7_CHLT3|nr:STAS domain-containing protein [Chloroherpeton thalassium]ACF14124.1 anti-sigma-factor antagonist [Chloroherpeton thalassium ATCC 35110]